MILNSLTPALILTMPFIYRVQLKSSVKPFHITKMSKLSQETHYIYIVIIGMHCVVMNLEVIDLVIEEGC